MSLAFDSTSLYTEAIAAVFEYEDVVEAILYHDDVNYRGPTGTANMPVVFDLADGRLDKVIDNQHFPWLILHRTSNGKLNKMDDHREPSCLAFDNGLKG